MANPGNGRETSTAKLGSLIFAVVICRLAWMVAASEGPDKAAAQSNFWPNSSAADGGSVGGAGQPAQQTACDSLFIANEKLAKYCLCKDQQPLELLQVDRSQAAAAAATTTPTRGPLELQISQLSCQPNDLGSLAKDLASVLVMSWSGQEELTFQIDYLNINTNITAASGRSIVGPIVGRAHRRRFQIDHISLQLHQALDDSSAMGPTNRLDATGPAEGRPNGAESERTTTVADQMIDFCGLINETHLQFLSIFIAESHELASVRQLDEADALVEIRLTELLAKLSSLARLELNLEAKSHRLVLEREMIRHQTRLKWLNLASNRALNVGAFKRRSPFAWSSQLEYLSLELCNLAQFPLFSLFPIQFRLASPLQQQQSRGNSSANQVAARPVYGLPNLATLNLASNKIKSLERDLFVSVDDGAMTRTICHEETSEVAGNSRVFVLPSLTQLDLSGNQLEGLTLRAGQLILCTMPNLSQLFLRRNNIKQMNLNSLLSYPIRWPHPAAFSSESRPTTSVGEMREIIFDEQPFGRPARSSRLEYLDVSHNKLVQISAIVAQQQSDSTSSTRIKWINLSQNKLTNLITLINSTLIDRLIFDESFNYDTSDDNNTDLRLDQMDRSFKLATRSLSLCDLLSPGSLSKKSSNFIDDREEESSINEILINQNKLTKLAKDDFLGERCADIQILRLSANRIQIISDKAFESLINLEILDLSFNALVNIETNTFSQQTKLRILNLAWNRIKSLDKRLIANLHELEELFLNNNELSELSGDLFTGPAAARLSVLDLSGNRLTYLDETIFSNLRQLRVLDLNMNQLKNTNYLSLFKQSDSGIIKTVNIVPAAHAKKAAGKKHRQSLNSKPTSLAEGGGSGSDSMKKVKTRHNRDTPEYAAGNILALAKNQLEAFNHATGRDSCNNQTFALDVQLLWLNDNKIRELHGDSFKCFQSVQRLYLQSNRLQTLDDLIFQSLNMLEFLDLSQNMLTKFNLPKILPQAPTLRHLDVSSNQLLELGLRAVEAETRLEFLAANANPNLDIESAELFELIAKSTSLRSIQFTGIRRIKSSHHGDDRAKQTLATIRAGRLHLERLHLGAFQIELDAIPMLYNFLSSDQIALESLSIGFGPKAATGLARLIAARLQLALEQLNLSGNQLDNEHLKSIILMNAGQSEESASSDAATFALKHLNLSSNLLESWPLGDRIVSAKLAELRSLDLSKNKIRYLMNNNNNSDTFGYTFGQLEYLNLSSNSMIGLIAQPPTQNLHKVSLGRLMPALKGIDLSYNRLSWIPVQLFEDLSELVWLRLDHNQLETLPSSLSTMTPSKRLAYIDFDHNKNMRSLASEASAHFDDETEASQRAYDLASFVGLRPELILFRDEGLSNEIRCQRIDEYVSDSTRRQAAASVSSFVGTQLGQLKYLHAQENANVASVDGQQTDAADLDNEQCHTLISLTRSISFNSIGPNVAANLGSLISFGASLGPLDNTSSGRLNDVSFRHNDLRTIEWANASAGIIRLDLRDNGIERMPSAPLLCWPELMSLDLSHNQIRELSLEWTLICPKLTYLDLSHNKIGSFVNGPQAANRATPSLLVLKLHHNSLTNLIGLPSHWLHALRLLDLRSNQLVSIQTEPLELRRPLLTLIHADHAPARMDTDRPTIRLDDTSVRFEWSESDAKKTYSSVSLDSFGQTLLASSEQAIKFCTLDSRNLTRICLHGRAADELQPPIGRRCLLLKVPKNTLPCSTDLQRAQSTAALDNSGEKPADSSSQQLASSRNASLLAEDDYVLRVIDSMKKNWLKLKEVDLNDYLVDTLRAGSVWVELGNRYQINSLAAIKLAIVVGSVCIIGLLVAIFTLLAYFSGPKSGDSSSQLDCESSSELTTVTGGRQTDSASFSSSSNAQNSRSAATTDCSNASSSAGSRGTRTSLQSSGEDTEHQLPETVLERLAPTTLQQHAAPERDHLQQNLAQLGPQICLTPSSSLAPSSIETAETMQAVDSIQSVTPNQTARGSVDQYAGADLGSQQSKQQCSYQQQQQQVATVLRMVKSSSANFEQTANRQRMRTAALGGQHDLRQQNYSTLRSKMRQFNEPAGDHLQPAASCQPVDAGSVNQMGAEPALGQHLGTDPTTISLLSLSSALSNSISNGNFSSSNNPTKTRREYPTDFHQHNLCQYHSQMMQHDHHHHQHHHQHQQQQQQQQPEVIQEQEENLESLYNAEESGLHLSVHNLPPPPPPRTMEALEFCDLNVYLSNDQRDHRR